MEKTRPGRLRPEARRFEDSLTSEMVKRAIYIDFEGFLGKAPSLIGVAIGSKFYQVALDEGLRLAAGAKKIPVRSGEDLVRDLLERAMREKRRIVAFSSCEKRICRDYYRLDLAPVYADANRVVKTWAARAYPDLKRRPKSLKAYLRLIGYPRAACLGERQAAQRIRAVRGMCARRGSYDALTGCVKAKWTKLLEYNKVDVLGMRELCRRAVSRRKRG
jgi:hypothetical protein